MSYDNCLSRMTYKVPVLKKPVHDEDPSPGSIIETSEISVRCFLEHGHKGAHRTSVRDEIVKFQ